MIPGAVISFRFGASEIEHFRFWRVSGTGFLDRQIGGSG
jgi:hypothetical protein